MSWIILCKNFLFCRQCCQVIRLAMLGLSLAVQENVRALQGKNCCCRCYGCTFTKAFSSCNFCYRITVNTIVKDCVYLDLMFWMDYCRITYISRHTVLFGSACVAHRRFATVFCTMPFLLLFFRQDLYFLFATSKEHKIIC